MKKILSILLLFVITIPCFSQKLNFGISAGLNQSKLISTNNFDDPKFKYKTGYQFNTIFEYNISPQIGIRTEPGYVNRGFLGSSPDLPDVKVNINYITLPIMLRYSLLERFSLLLGPELAYKLTAESTTDGNKNDLNFIYNRKVDFGLIAGFSYNIINNLEMGLQYNKGFISLTDDIIIMDDYGSVIGKTKLHNQGFSLIIRYFLNK